MIWNWPQIIYAIIAGTALLCTMAMDGQPRTGNYSVGAWAVAQAIIWFLLYQGGFFAGAHP